MFGIRQHVQLDTQRDGRLLAHPGQLPAADDPDAWAYLRAGQAPGRPRSRAISIRCTSRGALADLEDLRVAVEPARRVLDHEAVAAVDLGGGAGVVHRRLGGVELGDRRLPA